MITYNINALIGAKGSDKAAAVVKCHDTGVNLRVHLKKAEKTSEWNVTEKSYTVPTGAVAILKIKKPDNNYVLQDGKSNGTSVFFELPPQSFTAAGMASAEINIIGKDGRRITTDTFYIDVPKEVADDCAEDSKTYISIMGEQIKAIMEAVERAEAAAKSAETGATFTPSVSDDGTLSWENDKGLPNPAPVNIKGEKPRKHVDYFTPEEVQKMIDEVIKSLPTETWIFVLSDGTTVEKKVALL